MVPFPARRADDSEPVPSGTSSHSRIQPEIEELSSRLAAQGIQSTELVLDLVLHDLADEARQVLGATGAAVALERDGELVCRAAAGSTAPDLGVRIHTESGLSGICVRQRTTELCSDTEADSRVDSVACRRLGVRSIAVVPLFAAKEIIGIFEVFSDRTNAFSSEHLRKLESLAAAAAESVKAARDKPGQSTPPESDTAVPVPDDSSVLSVASIMQKITPVDPAVKVLRWLVIGFAIPLVVLIGFDLGWHRASRAPFRGDAAAEAAPSETQAQPQSSSAMAGPALSPDSAPKISPARPKRKEDLISRGGLVIYQNGTVIYREEPRDGIKPAPTENTQARAENSGVAKVPAKASGDSKANPAPEKAADIPAISLPPGVTGGSLVHSVHPKYPAEAILQKLEGPVMLHGTVGEDGVIRDLKLVSGNPILSAAALDAVQQWRYEPYRKNGAPIAMPIDITIDFNLPK